MATSVAGYNQQFFRNCPVSLTWEGTIQIPAINRRGSGGVFKSRIVHEGQNNDSPSDCFDVQLIGQLGECNRAFILVSMIAASEEHSRADPVFHDGDRNHDRTPRRVIT